MRLRNSDGRETGPLSRVTQVRCLPEAQMGPKLTRRSTRLLSGRTEFESLWTHDDRA